MWRNPFCYHSEKRSSENSDSKIGEKMKFYKNEEEAVCKQNIPPIPMSLQNKVKSESPSLLISLPESERHNSKEKSKEMKESSRKEKSKEMEESSRRLESDEEEESSRKQESSDKGELTGKNKESDEEEESSRVEDSIERKQPSKEESPKTEPFQERMRKQRQIIMNRIKIKEKPSIYSISTEKLPKPENLQEKIRKQRQIMMNRIVTKEKLSIHYFGDASDDTTMVNTGKTKKSTVEAIRLNKNLEVKAQEKKQQARKRRMEKDLAATDQKGHQQVKKRKIDKDPSAIGSSDIYYSAAADNWSITAEVSTNEARKFEEGESWWSLTIEDYSTATEISLNEAGKLKRDRKIMEHDIMIEEEWNYIRKEVAEKKDWEFEWSSNVIENLESI